jgi:hypothetical protein
VKSKWERSFYGAGEIQNIPINHGRRSMTGYLAERESLSDAPASPPEAPGRVSKPAVGSEDPPEAPAAPEETTNNPSTRNE